MPGKAALEGFVKYFEINNVMDGAGLIKFVPAKKSLPLLSLMDLVSLLVPGLFPYVSFLG
jgi:hypothetical protein